MSKKNHAPGPVPPANQPHAGPPGTAPADPSAHPDEHAGDNFQDQDAKRRLGDFTGTGEHARVQPTQLNDGNTHSK